MTEGNRTRQGRYGTSPARDAESTKPQVRGDFTGMRCYIATRHARGSVPRTVIIL